MSNFRSITASSSSSSSSSYAHVIMGGFNTSLPEVEGVTGASEYRWESGGALERQAAIFDLMSTFRCHAASTFLTAHQKPH
eukprot:7250195-Pyramimonas_sp.AAC.1